MKHSKTLFATPLVSMALAVVVVHSQLACGNAAVPVAQDAGLVGVEPTTRASDAGLATSDDAELMLFKDIPVVVAAGMREQTLHQAAASVSVVNANEIELFNYRSLADVLRAQRSFYIDNNGLNQFAGIRGFQRAGDANARMLVLQDGRPTNELIVGQSNIDQDFTLPMEAVKRVEIVRGPGSSLYGTNAMFGVVNVVTKDGADVNGVVTKVEGGTQDTVHGNVLYGERFKNGLDVLVDVTGFSTAGNQDIVYDGVTDAAHDFGHIRSSDDQNSYSGLTKLRAGDLTLEVDSANRTKDDSTATYLTSWFNPGYLEERRTNVTLRLDHDFSNGQDLHAMMYYGHYDSRIASIYDHTEAAVPFTYYTNAEDDWVGQQIHYGWQVNKDLHLLAGADATESLHTRQHDNDTIHGPVLNEPASYSSLGLFAEAEQKVTPWLSVIAGGRFDEVQRVGSNLSPRLAAIVTPDKEDTFKILYGSAFRSPTLSDLLYQTPPPAGVIANPQLKPEKIDTYELVWERQYGNGLETSLNGYLWKMDNEIDTVLLPDGSTQQQNLDSLWAHGIEAELDKKWDTGAMLRTYATFGRATDHGAGLTHSPAWITGASVVVPVINKNTFISIEPQIVGQMKNDLGEYTEPTFLTNVVFTSRDFYKGWTFQAGVYNLFGNFGRLPRDGPFDQYQTTLNDPVPEALISLAYKF